MKLKVSSLILAFIVIVASIVNISAVSEAKISSTEIETNNSDEQIIVLRIDDNPGIMGFKLTFTYPTDCIEFISSTKGDVTSKGMYNDNINLIDGQFDILWNNTEEVTQDGTIALLKCRVLSDKSFSVDVSYSQADTFNENWEDVVLVCNPIETSGSKIATENSENETQVNTEGYTSNAYIDVEYIITDILEDKQMYVDSAESEDYKAEILDEANKQINSIGGPESYFSSYEELLSEYQLSLQKKMIADLDSLNTDLAPGEILNDYLKSHNMHTIDECDVRELLYLFESQGLSNIYRENLTDEQLYDVFSQVYDAQQEYVQVEVESDKSEGNLMIVLVVTGCSVVFIGCVLSFVIYKKRGAKNER